MQMIREAWLWSLLIGPLSIRYQGAFVGSAGVLCRKAHIAANSTSVIWANADQGISGLS
jgi:hypothetical protein